MLYGVSTRPFSNERLNSRLLDRILEAGFREIEIYGAPEHLNYHDPNHVRDVAQWFADLGVGLHSVHAPIYSEPGGGRRGGFAISIAYLERRLRLDSCDEIKRTLEIAERIPFRFLVLHFGLEHDEYGLDRYDAAFTSLEHLNVFAKERGVTLVLENTGGELATPARVVQFLEYTHLNHIRLCFDTGHAHLGKGARETLGIFRERMATVHLHDNHGAKDEHLAPFEGDIDWPPLLRELEAASAATPGGLCSLIELKENAEAPPDLQKLRRVAEKLRKTAERPAETTGEDES